MESYQKGGDHRRWDEYAEKIPVAVKEKLKEILIECARNGFVAPYAFDGKLQWRRVMTNGKQEDLCTLCRRDCQKRKDIDEGDGKWRKQNIQGYHEPDKCWEKTP